MKPDAIFVYGTLLPGLVRWPILSPFTTGEWHNLSVPGRLYDTGHGYPAAVFDGPDTVGRDAVSRDSPGGLIDGLWLRLAADQVDAALLDLDEAEDVEHGDYVRMVLDTAHGPTWAYEYRSGCVELTLLGRRWPPWSGGGPPPAE